MEDVISLHQRRVNQIEGRSGSDKEADEGRQRVYRTQRVKTVELKVVCPNRWTKMY